MWFLPNPSQASAHTAKKEVMNDFFFYALFAKHLRMNPISAAQAPERTHMHRRSAVYVL